MTGRTRDERVARQPFIVSDGTGLRRLRGPAVIMCDPKHVVNVSSMIRNCAAFGINTLCLTGDRIELPSGKKRSRMPREERMREYETVRVIQHDFPLTLFANSVVPVAVELLAGAVPLPMAPYIHGDETVYVLGPEDGSVPAGLRACCQHFVQIPTKHCLNVAMAGGIVLYDRVMNMWRENIEELPTLTEHRGMITT